MAAICLGPYLFAGAATAAPFIPTADDEVLERLPAARDPQIRDLRTMRQSLARTPRDLALAADLATRYLRLGRAQADPRYFGYAQAALTPWWDAPGPPAEVLVLRAVIRQSRHDFAGALADLAKVNEVSPDNAQAWLSRSVVYRVLGDYAAAIDTCRPLSRLVRRLLVTACATSAAALGGRAEQSYSELETVLRRSPSVDPGTRLWVLSLLADMAVGLGRVEAAERHLQTALGLGERNASVLAAYADLLLDEGRADAVLELLASERSVDGLLLRLAIAERRAGAATLDAHVRDLEGRFAATRARGDQPHLRSEARFYLQVLGRPAKALASARANWDRQKEPWDARLLLEAALATGNSSAAEPVLEHLAKNNTEHVVLRRLASQVQGMR